ncbi:hypothetical protein HB780_24570 [Rhizobium lusitanum]|uniref:hypothetical protein n=1 Tax=Rhizobium lusitanum TaxID=293958 RepID=UPI0016097FE4|nr:hypothetical protein [Rhizobium lusitanum]QND46809.1 hypothetical protein HB780_24570 [Rhizobium lusitanum]
MTGNVPPETLSKSSGGQEANGAAIIAKAVFGSSIQPAAGGTFVQPAAGGSVVQPAGAGACSAADSNGQIDALDDGGSSIAQLIGYTEIAACRYVERRYGTCADIGKIKLGIARNAKNYKVCHLQSLSLFAQKPGLNFRESIRSFNVT